MAEVDHYGTYLHIDEILGAQHPLSDEHDETMFIIIHQATELWLKLVIHEIDLAQRQIVADDLGPAFKALSRVARIQHVLIESWQVLATMTPTDYLQFRDLFGSASGFQSVQYRAIEFLLGRRDERYLAVHGPEDRAFLTGIMNRTSLYDDVIALLAARGFETDGDEAILAAWEAVYRDPTAHWDLYELAEKLVDLEHAFNRWRYEHYQTVYRIIGRKPGSGGTDGLGYLRKALDFVFFPHLWEVRTRL